MSFKSTNELWNIDIHKILKNLNMKPRKNPMHYRFIDTSEDVFGKFKVNSEYTDKGGHNFIFKNENFAIRISRKKFCILDENKFDEYVKSTNDDYICLDSKRQDEIMLLKAIKHNISPRVYYFGNISINDTIHRFCVFESYNMSLCKFIRRNKAITLLDTLLYYQNIQDINDDIVNQLEELVDKTLRQNIVYYDMKPENVVINFEKTKNIELKIIDWDSDFCVEEDFVSKDEYKECAKFLMMFIMTAYMNNYLKNKMFNKRLRELYNEELLSNIFYLIFDVRTEFITIILQYFYNSFGMTLQSKDDFDEKNELMKESFKKCFDILVNKCIM